MNMSVNFPVAEGTTFVSSETLVVPRGDGIAEKGLDRYRAFERVGQGCARFPPGTSEKAVAEENFEQCFIMAMQPDEQGVVRAMLVAEDRSSAAYVRYNVNHFQKVQRAFQLWKNPRDAVSGLEVGSTFLGWTYAAENGLLCRVKKGEVHRYEIEIGFLRTREEIDTLARDIPIGDPATLKVMDAKSLVGLYKGEA